MRYRTWGDDISYSVAADRGRTAAVKGISYDRNPYHALTQPGLHLHWSSAHNGMRAKLLMEKD
jgi:hypothetical protein